MSDIVNDICEKLQLDPRMYMLRVEAPEKKRMCMKISAYDLAVISLFPWVPLRDQEIPASSEVLLRKRETQALDSQGILIHSMVDVSDVNIWNEPPHTPHDSHGPQGFTLNALVIQLTSEADFGFGIVIM